MTDLDLTHILVVRDRSGSMSSIKRDTDGGFDAFIAEQAKEPGRCFVTLVDFDNQYEEVFTNVPIQDVPKSNLQPRGSTALYDALATAVVNKGIELAALPEEERPGSVIVLVLTDGYENASREWTQLEINRLVTEQQEKYSWAFVFLGANQDAVLVGKDLGFSPQLSLTYSGQNVGQVFTSTASNVSAYRGARKSGGSYGVAVAAAAFTDEQRDEAVSN